MNEKETKTKIDVEKGLKDIKVSKEECEVEKGLKDIYILLINALYDNKKVSASMNPFYDAKCDVYGHNYICVDYETQTVFYNFNYGFKNLDEVLADIYSKWDDIKPQIVGNTLEDVGRTEYKHLEF